LLCPSGLTGLLAGYPPILKPPKLPPPPKEEDYAGYEIGPYILKFPNELD